MAKKQNIHNADHAEDGEQTDHVSAVLTYGDDLSCNFAGLPAVSQLALAQRGFNHLMGSEVASKVKAKKDAAETAAKEGKGEALSDEAIADLTAGFRAGFMTALTEGKLGHRNGGPKLRGIDKLIRDVAIERITAWAAKNGKKLPSGKGAAERMAGIIETYMSNATRAEEVRVEADRRLTHQEEGVEGFDFE